MLWIDVVYEADLTAVCPEQAWIVQRKYHRLVLQVIPVI
jgi:hypothetical protein